MGTPSLLGPGPYNLPWVGGWGALDTRKYLEHKKRHPPRGFPASTTHWAPRHIGLEQESGDSRKHVLAVKIQPNSPFHCPCESWSFGLSGQVRAGWKHLSAGGYLMWSPFLSVPPAEKAASTTVWWRKEARSPPDLRARRKADFKALGHWARRPTCPKPLPSLLLPLF